MVEELVRFGNLSERRGEVNEAASSSCSALQGQPRPGDRDPHLRSAATCLERASREDSAECEKAGKLPQVLRRGASPGDDFRQLARLPMELQTCFMADQPVPRAGEGTEDELRSVVRKKVPRQNLPVRRERHVSPPHGVQGRAQVWKRHPPWTDCHIVLTPGGAVESRTVKRIPDQSSAPTW